MNFTGRSALVTGGASGIGRATCLSFAEKDAFVWVADMDDEGAARTVAMIARAGGHAEAVHLDVRSEQDWAGALDRSDSAAPPLISLVNCAGKSILADSFSMALEDLRLLLAVNVEGAFLGMKHGIPRIAEAGGGAVLNISSVMALQGKSRMAAYCASKGATRMMTKAIALECAELGNMVRVNSVHPGVVDTPAWQKHSADEAGMMTDTPSSAGGMLDVHMVARDVVPIGVACAPEEVAETVCFLASDAARHITGAEIVIDGGMSAA